mmetsp:Transcript_143400/g.458407  ORF Transcript_143400/g.458407 Transcript_143400/m.458407 type:complete len:256 (-) Transcript_143400:82-849(-)
MASEIGSELKGESYKITGDPRKPDGAPSSSVKMTCSRSNFRAAGWQEEDFKKPIITIAAPYSNSMPCNNQFLDLANILVEEVERLGGKAHLAITPVISDGQTQGTRAMRYSLVSRELIADCIELMHEGYHADAIITLGGRCWWTHRLGSRWGHHHGQARCPAPVPQRLRRGAGLAPRRLAAEGADRCPRHALEVRHAGALRSCRCHHHVRAALAFTSQCGWFGPVDFQLNFNYVCASQNAVLQTAVFSKTQASLF